MAGIHRSHSRWRLFTALNVRSDIVGGMVRLGVDKYLRRKFADKSLSEEQLVAETDKSAGVLLASGYIAEAHWPRSPRLSEPE